MWVLNDNQFVALTNLPRSAIIMAHYRGVAQLAEQPSPKYVRPRGAFVLTVSVQYH